MERIEIKVSPNVKIILGSHIFSDTCSVMIEEMLIDKTVRTVCYLDDKELDQLKEGIEKLKI